MSSAGLRPAVALAGDAATMYMAGRSLLPKADLFHGEAWLHPGLAPFLLPAPSELTGLDKVLHWTLRTGKSSNSANLSKVDLG